MALSKSPATTSSFKQSYKHSIIGDIILSQKESVLYLDFEALQHINSQKKWATGMESSSLYLYYQAQGSRRV